MKPIYAKIIVRANWAAAVFVQGIHRACIFALLDRGLGESSFISIVSSKSFPVS